MPLLPYADPLTELPGVGQGWQEVIVGTQPAAAANFTLVNAGQYHTLVLSMYCRLVTGAGATARAVVFQYLDPEGNVLAATTTTNTQAAGSTINYCYALNNAGIQSSGSNVQVWTGSLYPMLVRPGDQMQIFVVANQGTDQLSRIRLVVNRWYTKEPYGAPRRRPRRRNPLG